MDDFYENGHENRWISMKKKFFKETDIVGFFKTSKEILWNF